VRSFPVTDAEQTSVGVWLKVLRGHYEPTLSPTQVAFIVEVKRLIAISGPIPADLSITAPGTLPRPNSGGSIFGAGEEDMRTLLPILRAAKTWEDVRRTLTQ
jgi:hypothetical protein